MISNKYDPYAVQKRSLARKQTALGIGANILNMGLGLGLNALAPGLGSVAGATMNTNTSDLSKESISNALPKSFAYGGKMYAMGGMVEVEGGEAVNTVNGVQSITGPTHENGGVPYAPQTKGEYVFSNRIGYNKSNRPSIKPVKSATFSKIAKKVSDTPEGDNTLAMIQRDNNQVKQGLNMVAQVRGLNKMTYGGKLKKYALGGDPNDPLKITPLTGVATPIGYMSQNMYNQEMVVPPSTRSTFSSNLPIQSFPELGSTEAETRVAEYMFTDFDTPSPSTNIDPYGGRNPNNLQFRIPSPQDNININATPNFGLFNTAPTIQGVSITGTPTTPSTSTNTVGNKALGAKSISNPVTTGSSTSNTRRGISNKYGLGVASKLLGVGVNIAEGLFGQPEVQPFRANTQSQRTDRRLNNMRFDNAALQNRLALSRRAAINNARRSRSEQVAQSLSQSANAASTRAAMETELQKQSMQNQIDAQVASVLNARGENDRQTLLNVDNINAANRAAKRNLLDTGLGQLSQLGTGLMEADIRDRDAKYMTTMMDQLVKDFGLDPETAQRIISGNYQGIDNLVKARRK